MRADHTSLKNKLSNFAHYEVLEIMGLSSLPLSSTQVERRYPTHQNSYCYTLIKDLAENGFLQISYKQNIETRKRVLLKNQRYRLNLKGFLLYLFSASRNNRIKPRTINKITEIFLDYNSQFDFFEDLNAFDDLDEKINTLLNVALELQNQLKDITTEYIANYMIRRFYSDIAEQEAWSSIQNNPLWKMTSRFIKKGHKSYFARPSDAQLEIEKDNKVRMLRFWEYKKKILDKLIKVMETDLERVKKQRQFELEFPR